MKYDPYASGLHTAVFDIETTGLSPDTGQIILTGILDVSDGSVVQHFAGHPSEESEVLQHTIDALNRYDAVITYNGDSFDWPFLRKRAAKYGLHTERSPFISIDVYRLLKQYWPQAARLPNVKQTTVEAALGLSKNRADIIDGAESVQLYRQYVRTGEAALRNDILLHNSDDIRQLASIADSLSFLPYHRIAAERGFLVKGAQRSILIQNVDVRAEKVAVQAQAERGMMPVSIYAEHYTLEYDSTDGRISLDIPCESRGEYAFVDAKVLPVNTEEFERDGGYRDGFILLREGDDIRYRAACALSRQLLQTAMKEELNG